MQTILHWNEIKSRALLFSRTWGDASNEDSQAKPFWIAFFEFFGITNKRVATFELNVKKLVGAQGFVDLFWPGMLLVEHKSRGKNLDHAVDQAVGYLHNLKEHELPQLVVVCDFARFRVRRLVTGETCGRLESRYIYSNTIVNNNYPWPGIAGETPSDKHRTAIKQSRPIRARRRRPIRQLVTGRPLRPTDHAPGHALSPPKTRRSLPTQRWQKVLRLRR